MIVGAVAPLIQGDVPPPIIEVFSADEVKTALVGFIVALLGLGASLMLYLKHKFDSQQADLKAVKHETVNNHGPDGKDDNLRDQIDRVERVVTDGFRRMDHSFGEVHDRQQATDARALEEHKRIWDELRSKEDKIGK